MCRPKPHHFRMSSSTIPIQRIYTFQQVYFVDRFRENERKVFFLLLNNRLRRNVKRSKINSHTGANGIPSKHRLQTGGRGYCCLITKEEVNKTFGLNSVIRRMLQDSKNNNKHNLYIHAFYFGLLTNIGDGICVYEKWRLHFLF